MDQWPYALTSYTQKLVIEHCIRDNVWQKFRLSLKGIPTTDKLDALETWYEAGIEEWPEATNVQVSNYLAALRRAGILDMQNRVKK